MFNMLLLIRLPSSDISHLFHVVVSAISYTHLAMTAMRSLQTFLQSSSYANAVLFLSFPTLYFLFSLLVKNGLGFRF